jgi:phosphoglucosamine mutase
LEIEALKGCCLEGELAAPTDLGRAKRVDDAQARYIEIVKATLPRRFCLNGLRVVVDCANGAAYKVAPAALWELGAEVIPMGVHPDGYNINAKCGSTAPEAMAERVREVQADIGLALDGDADRLIVCDEKGKLVDGDQLLALLADLMHAQGTLANGAVIATVMSNLGLERYLKAQGLRLERVNVGDRYVVNRMRSGGFNLGGEQSGHLVMTDYATTGDGLLAGVQILAALVQDGKPASLVLNRFTPVPQVLKNVRYEGRAPLARETVQSAIRDADAELNGCGRLLVRKSGTEPLIRIMAEGDDESRIGSIVDRLASMMATA